MTTLVTYKIEADNSGRLKTAGKTACNFWNRFVSPRQSIVIRLGIFTSFGNTIARAYKPYQNGGIIYGVVEFNTKYLAEFSDNKIAGTVVHEIGHTLGFGWDHWMTLFNQSDGHFKQAAVSILPSLAEMQVETDYGPGTTLSHWDEESFGGELMTGFKNSVEYVLPVTIDVTELLGHTVIEQLAKRTYLDELLTALKDVQFALTDVVESLDRDYFVETELWEEIYTDK
ncbi:leishmanolysin-related zinc metalloendopeptidase [Desulforegula conservatrix]|uniref:leishmanolysin-related zinc metalloendopeptidase n=1 Tax=Desulforegula conservatrix TaxID=153026 RepID=UPI00041E3CB2|nr:leishmanolysin-related zinc metalloendopeptidase [Desulforegula conservatrix]